MMHDIPERPPSGPSDVSFWKAAAVLFATGLVGVLALYPTLGPTARRILERPEMQTLDLPAGLLQLLLLVNPVLYLALGVVVGTLLAPRIGLHSHLAETSTAGPSALRRVIGQVAPALAWGVAVAVLIVALDIVSRPMLGASADALNDVGRQQPRAPLTMIAGILYGGLTEEIMVRWGLLSLVAWLPWRIRGRKRSVPGSTTMWIAIFVAALLFGAGHLGAVAAVTDLTAILVARTILLNAIGGVVFGWLFWSKSLEAAMIAHAVGHVVFAAVTWLGIGAAA